MDKIIKPLNNAKGDSAGENIRQVTKNVVARY